jgi:cyclohexyl-isocyanide hydratase
MLSCGLSTEEGGIQAMPQTIQIGLLVFPKLTQLELTGPLQVFSRVPGARLHLIWKRIEPVPSDTVLTLLPTKTFEDCPQLDVICVPGGSGSDEMINDTETLDFLRTQAAGARYITSVCTGSLILGAAGLLDGYRATTHWSALQHLASFGATAVKDRVCTDRNRITGGGVTAGIDFALMLACVLTDQITAEMIQLSLEYNPSPPFAGGAPEIARPEVLLRVNALLEPHEVRRRGAVEKAATRMAPRHHIPTVSNLV